jgi:hypothetical protein
MCAQSNHNKLLNKTKAFLHHSSLFCQHVNITVQSCALSIDTLLNQFHVAVFAGVLLLVISVLTAFNLQFVSSSPFISSALLSALSQQ